jgi:hypothetical protein
MRSIINVMTHWVTMPYFNVDANVLPRMMDFASSIQVSEPMNNFSAQELHSAITERVRIYYFRQCLILSHRWLL